MRTDSYDFEIEPLSRPSFLTALCILTFIGSGWSLLSSVWTYTTAAKTANIFVEIKHSDNEKLKRDSVNLHPGKHEQAFETKMKSSLSQMLTKDNIRKKSIGSFVAALLTLSGAIFMWRLKRVGFYLYGNNFLAVGLSAFGSFFGLIFIALYALNYGSLRK
jgi:hypothetical protein